jgi:CheY-like chemotaxis protein
MPPVDALRILVVEDDANSREALAMLLSDAGHIVEECANGRVALSKLSAGDYDVLLTDLVMPGMSGLELVNAARASAPRLRCVIISGQAPIEDAPVLWLGKPLDVDALLAVLVR